MLTLQRASAGSGKTYTLTKKYIRLLISIPESGNPESIHEMEKRRLRTRAELEDSVQHILAVTFTNKATNEMKERILGKLNDLAFPPDPGNPFKADYMKDFTEEFNVEPKAISAVCAEALKQVLYYYSDFNVSTIDSFFQTILRTFAYESDLPDAYQLIIGSEDISKMAAKELVDDFSSGKLSREEREWLGDEIEGNMSQGNNAWRIFQRNDENPRGNLFKEICEMGESLEKEEFKAIKEDLEKYFAEGGNLREAYREISSKIDERNIVVFAKLRDAAKELKEAYESLLEDESFASQAIARLKKNPTDRLEWQNIIFDGNSARSCVTRLLAKDADPADDYTWTKLGAGSKTGEKVFNSKLSKLRDYAPRVEGAVEKMREAYMKWLENFESGDNMVWNLIKPGLSRLAIMINLRDRVNRFLSDNDAMQLADTNTILRRIISDDDVPFIYERTGSRINHFLIDEFQDTSLLQWQNFRPLLAESQGKGNENLIIGDAKQSIYRFRNAEPKLITNIVPATFHGDEIDLRGFSVDENANWRSLRNVVKFNNFVFYHLSRMLDGMNVGILKELRCDDPEEQLYMPSIAELYSNTAQLPKSKVEEDGYVEVSFVSDSKSQKDGTDDDVDEEKGKVQPEILEQVGALVEDLLKRGYRQRDIAILVNTRAAGEQIITYLMDYARVKKDELPHLQFVSEDSLRLGRSEAVMAIIECFKMIQSGIEGDFDNEGDKKNRGGSKGDASAGHKRVNWVDVGHKFRNFSMKHPELDLHSRLESFLNQEYADERLEELLDGMQAVTLPSLLEMIVENFIPADIRAEEAPFIAAFADALQEYCDAYPTDVASMLKWWERSGKKRSISSPEGTEAINVMTVHKSKGLEFNCVICPDLNLNFSMRPEWSWMKVPQDLDYASLVPAQMPMRVSKTMVKATNYLPYVRKYCEMQHLHEVDQINKGYVALTRAVGELYIFMKLSEDDARSKNTFNFDLKKILNPEAERGNDVVSYIDAVSAASDASDSVAVNPDSVMLRIEDVSEESIWAEQEPGKAGEKKAGESGKEKVKILPRMVRYSYGSRIADVREYLKNKEAKEEEKKEESAKNPDSLNIESDVRDIEDYYVNSDRKVLKYHEEGYKPKIDPADDDRMDPRSEGTLLHAVLERVMVEDDLPRAFEYMHARGKMTREDIRRFEPELRRALESVREMGWFGGIFKVFAEHPVISILPELKRPDRVMISPDGEGVVVDYKFGTSENGNEHRRQVKEYMDLMLKSGICRRVSGYLWYLRDCDEFPGGRLEEVKSD